MKITYYGKDYTRLKDCICNTLIDNKPLYNDTQINEYKNKNELDNFSKLLYDILESFLSSKKVVKFDEFNSYDSKNEDESQENKKIFAYKSDYESTFQGKVGMISLKKFNFEMIDDINYDDNRIKEVFGDIRRFDSKSFDIELKIVTRFDSSFDKPYLLVTLLSADPLKIVESSLEANIDGELFDILLINLYREYLKITWELGIYKTYVTYEKNDDKLKGTIDFNRYIKNNLGIEDGKISYSHREYTADNPLNYLIIKTYEYVNKKYSHVDFFDIETIDIINTLKSELLLDDYFVGDIIKNNLKPIVHPFYFDYEIIRKICLKILRDEGIELFDLNDSEIKGFLGYVPKLWEKYLGKCFYKNGINAIEQYNNDIIIDENSVSLGTAIPDFVIQKNVILDAKFVKGWDDLIDNKSLSASRMQDYNKCIRDMNMLSLSMSGVLFPTFKNNFIRKYKVSLNNNDSFYALGINIPNDNIKYYEWLNQFEKSSKEIFEFISNEILGGK